MAQETEVTSSPPVGENCTNCKRLDRAYVGGLFDGEGTIHFAYRKSPSKNVATTNMWVSLCSIDKSIIDYLYGLFGGMTYTTKAYMQKGNPPKNSSQLWYWRQAHKGTFTFLRSILPYSKLKREQAECLISMESVICKIGHRSLREKESLVALAEKIGSFNKKGRASRFQKQGGEITYVTRPVQNQPLTLERFG